MAKKQEQQTPIPEPEKSSVKETILVVDIEQKEVLAVSNIKEVSGDKRIEWVRPEQKNQPAFYSVKSSPLIAGYLTELIKIAMDRDRAAGIDTRNKPARYAFYKVPFGQVEKVAGAVRQVLANNKDTEAKQIINPYYTTARNLSNVKHESYEIPKEELKTLYGIDLDKYPDALSKLSSNLHCSELFDIKQQLSDRIGMPGKVGLEFYKDENDVTKVEIIIPSNVREYRTEELSKYLSRSEIMELNLKNEIGHLVEFPDRHTGAVNACHVAYDTKLGRTVAVPRKEARITSYYAGVFLDDDKTTKLSIGETLYVEGMKTKDGAVYNGNVKYSPIEGTLVTTNKVYKEPYIFPAIRSQLNKQDLEQLYAGQAIDGRKLVTAKGTRMNCFVWISHATNGTVFGTQKGWEEENKAYLAREAEKQEQQSQSIPEQAEEIPQQRQGQSMRH